jgi:CheY-like chemotaxis protein/putative methionine-R-sulfoxide reductase with GAF domain
VLFCCLIGWFGFKGMSEIKVRLDDMHSNLIPSIVVASTLDHYTQEYRRVYLRSMLEENQQQRKALFVRMSALERSIQKALEQFEKFPLLPQERVLFQTVTAQIQEMYQATEKVRSALDSGTSYDDLAAEHQQIRKLSNQLDTNINQLMHYNATEAEEHFRRSSSAYTQFRYGLLSVIMFSTLFAIIITLLITRQIVNPLQVVLDTVHKLQTGGKEKARLVASIASGDLSQELTVTEPLTLEEDRVSQDETGTLLKAVVEMSETQHALDLAFVRMAQALRHNSEQERLLDWFKNGQSELNTILRGDKSTAEITEQVLSFLVGYIGAGVGVFYVFNEQEAALQIAASYAFIRRKRLSDRLALGEGLAGQAARERKMICLSSAPPGYLPICSGIGTAEPVNIVALPLLHDDVLTGVLEIGSFSVFSDNQLEFLNQCREAIAIALNVNRSRQRVNELLEQTQAQTEELQVQQEELQQTNEELEERAEMLEHQREEIRAKNRVVEEASQELQRKADELERVSTYKSEFLANMSHELRTPLNSMMILSSLLKDNREGNLTDKQVDFAATINTAGRDLLNLINDILDLSKIESGHLEFHYEELLLQEVGEQMKVLFHPVAVDKGITVTATLEESAPHSFITDSQRTMQILKNLLSNACKFTNRGSVSLRIYKPDSAENPLGTQAAAFAVTDTGIGIPADKQGMIFNAFQQADGSTSRTYGGTGLGLSISRQLARSLGGEITLTSEPGKGSTFTLYLPVAQTGQGVETKAVSPVRPVNPSPKPLTFDPLPAPLPDDRDLLADNSKSILVIEDDLTFAGILADMVRQRDFLVLIAADGESGIALAERYQPNAVILDVMLPTLDGWGVMRSLKDNPKTRHIPVHFITCLEERQKAMNMGAIGYVTKPVNSDQLDTVFAALENAIAKTTKKLLIVEDDPIQVQAMVALLEERSVSIRVAESGAAAIEQLGRESFDCIVLDLGLSDMGAFEMLEELKKLDPERRIPVIIHTGRELTHEDELRLHHYAESIIIKGAKSPERLLNEVTLFLHLVESSLDPGKQRMIRASLDKEAMLAGKKVLIVDDDMRNIFSLSSALSEKEMIILEAENGLEALKRLDAFPDTDLVLMDIMMPEMDGYEAMRAIRKDSRFHDLPIIALTAKAMKGDREECLKSGASDYIPKPVDMEKLFSLLRVWLYSAG